MMLSPLKLHKYFFTRINIEASQKPCCDIGKISTKITCGHKDDDERQWLVTLKVILDKSEDEKTIPPYTGELEILGFFTIDSKYPADNVHKLVHFNAPAMLYGAVREMVFNLTARGPNPHINLPTVSFLDNTPKKGNESKENNVSLPKTGKPSRKQVKRK